MLRNITQNLPVDSTFFLQYLVTCAFFSNCFLIFDLRQLYLSNYYRSQNRCKYIVTTLFISVALLLAVLFGFMSLRQINDYKEGHEHAKWTKIWGILLFVVCVSYYAFILKNDPPKTNKVIKTEKDKEAQCEEDQMKQKL